MTLRVYLAGPDVFEQDALKRGRSYVEAARSRGLVGMFPLDNQIDFSASDPSFEIYQANAGMIHQADVIVANLNDFRGMEPDSGTVWEVAYGIGLGKRVVAYVSSPATIAERVQHNQVCSRLPDGSLVDAQGRIIEDFGHPLNLMIQHSLEALIIGGVEDALDYVAQNREAAP